MVDEVFLAQEEIEDVLKEAKLVCVPAMPPGKMKEVEIVADQLQMIDVEGNVHKATVTTGCDLPPGLVGKKLKEKPIEEPIKEALV